MPQLQPDQIDRAWATLKIEVVYAPKTGNIKPWELYGVFTFPHPMRKHWASFKTEAAAKRRATVLRKKYPQAAEGQTEAVFEQGYDIDRAYAEADRHAAGSNAWHYWMDEAKRLEKLHRKGA